MIRDADSEDLLSAATAVPSSSMHICLHNLVLAQHSQQGIEPRHKILGGCHDLLDLNQYAPPLMDLSDP